MRAAVYDRLGSADVLQVVDLPRPEPAPGEVRVRVRVSAVMRRNLTLRFMMIYTVPPAALRAAVEEVNAAVTAGDLTELPVIRYGLDQTAEAHRAVEDGATGKVVVEL